MSNRLASEDSPYLQQHKNNPIDWYPWCDEAFLEAKKSQKAIFISIGYSSCHWCHVMESETFENEDVGAYLNAHFICIKVDREERPDIDAHYQNVHQILTNKAGGWPTSIFATPDNRPFFAGTYIPLESHSKTMGFKQLLSVIAPAIKKGDARLFENADAVDMYLKQLLPTHKPAPIERKMQQQFLQQARSNFEPSYGGFGTTPKFPQTPMLHALMSLYQLEKNAEIASMLTHTLDNMAAGGLYDLVDGGFCRYSVDSEWLVPHFEKMTYDNALLCEVYLRAYHIFKDVYYLKIAQEVADFMGTFMMEDNLFYSASDADSDAGEGDYFIYTVQEVINAFIAAGFESNEAKKMTMRMGCSKAGNFEHKNILRCVSIRRPEWFEAVKPHLQALRHKRAYPFIDKKVQTSWSAMMVKSLFELSIHDKSYLHQAKVAMDALIDKMCQHDLMHCALVDKAPKISAFLEDYAYMGIALISAYEVSGEAAYLKRAESLAQEAITTYFDKGIWYFSRGDFEVIADGKDASYPSAVGVMVDLLLSLGSLCDKTYREIALTSLEFYAQDLKKEPVYYSYLLNQALRYQEEDVIVKVPKATEIEKIKNLTDAPFVKVFYHSATDYMLCSNHSCYKNASSLEALFDS